MSVTLTLSNNRRIIYKTLTFVISAIWIVNGLFCKVFSLVPRHEKIVANILGAAHSGLITKAIGVAEIFMAIWILSRFKTRLNAIVQIALIAAMNMLEFVLVPDLLLWGRMNAVFALILIIIIYCNEFIFNPKNLPQP